MKVLLLLPLFLASISWNKSFADNIILPSNSILFERNVGQYNSEYLYVAHCSGYQIGFTVNGFTLNYRENDSMEHTTVTFEGVSGAFEVFGADPPDTRISYYNGPDSSKWFESVPVFRTLYYRNIYSGIDLVFYENRNQQMEFDFIIAPGADPTNIRFITNSDKTRILNNGRISLNDIFNLDTPEIYQSGEGVVIPVEGQYQESSEGTISFSLGEYDHSKKLVIDPVIIYSTYLGENAGAETLSDLVVADDGSVFLLGKSNFNLQWFIAKLLPGKLEYEFINWYGGTDGFDYTIPAHITLDHSGNIIADVNTRDGGLPAVNAFRSNFSINPYIIDVYIIKLDRVGKILFSTYLGGEKVDPENNPLDLNGRDYSGGLSIDNQNNIYVFGETDGLNFPTTANALYKENVGNWDLFLTKFSPSGALLFSTLLGGFENDRINVGIDVKNGISLDTLGRVYLLGTSRNQIEVFPGSEQAFDKANDFQKSLLLIFDPLSEKFIYSTFLGEFEPRFLKVDNNNRVHLAGSGIWTDLIKPVSNNGDQFVMTLVPLEKKILFSSYLPCEECVLENLTLGSNDHIYFSASVPNESAPVTERIIEFPLGGRDIYLGEIDTEEGEMIFSVLAGGRDDDFAGGGLIVNSSNTKLYLGGHTESNDFHTTIDGLILHAPGNGDIFLTIFELSPLDTSLLIFDANPQFIETSGLGLLKEIKDIEEVEEVIRRVNTARSYITCDGVSQVLFKIPSEHSVPLANWIIKSGHGKIETPWSAGTAEFDGEFFFIGLYTPPDELPDVGEMNFIDGIVAVKVSLTIEFFSGTDKKQKKFEFHLIRPPVVLVHGTFDNPVNCWKTPINAASASLFQSLELNGFKVFTLDYSGTNGQKDTNSLFSEPSSSFFSNRKVVWENPGGIRDALKFYRETLKAAVTQADVVGHSMGGVLPRVLASDSKKYEGGYNPDYYRIDNFDKGDINRLISIASTHRGSDLSYFLNFFRTSWSNSQIPFLVRLSNTAIPFTSWLLGGPSATGAVKDQTPASPALFKIGPTQVPSHAIVCSVNSVRDFQNNEGEPETYATYANILNGATLFFYFYRAGLRSFLGNMLSEYKNLPSGLRNANQKRGTFMPLSMSSAINASKPSQFVTLNKRIDDGFSAYWQDWHLFLDKEDQNWLTDDRIEYMLNYQTTEHNMFETDDDFQHFIRSNQWDIISGETINADSIKKDEHLTAIDYLRYLIFKNDLNDGVVRFSSQTGGLAENFTTHFQNHIHSYAPRYPEIIEKVITLLKGGLINFDTSGFPSAGGLLPIEIPDPDHLAGLEKKYKEGCEAICWSGMVHSHADALAKLAARENIVLLTRPVNPDATPLIANHAATKGMNLKGKSSNWGPQKGYIAVDQRFSKLWELYADNPEERDHQIEKFNAKTQKQLMDGPEETVKRLLTITYSCPVEESFDVFFDPQEADAKKALYLVQKTEGGYETFHWLEDGDPACPLEIEPQFVQNLSHLDSLNVMANPAEALRDEDGRPRYYTADYDLLAIGFFDPGLAGWEDDPYQVDTLKNFDKQRGLITQDQLRLLRKINDAVRETGYQGGDVAHHGPENQFYILSKPEDGSPYVDYPVTAFYSENGVAKILGIPRGEKGFRDIYLKRFMAEKRREGYNLYENILGPGWKWNHFRPYSFERGWDDRDAPDLKSSPEEIPFPSNCDCQEQKSEVISEFEPIESFEPTQHRREDLVEQIFPNPAVHYFHVRLVSKEDQNLNYMIIDSKGSILMEGKLSLKTGTSDQQIMVDTLNDGSYTLILFNDKKMISKGFQVFRY